MVLQRRALIGGGMGLTAVGGARAQTMAAVTRIGVLSPSAEDDANVQWMLRTFREVLQSRGWVEGRTLRLDILYAGGDPAALRAHARTLVAQAPDLLFATTSVQTVAALAEATARIPIVFGSASDPVAAGLVQSWARPGGNITGFTTVLTASNAKYLELVKELAPGVSRVLVLLSSQDPSNLARFTPIQAAGPGLGIEVGSADIRSAGDIERAVDGFAEAGGGAVIVITNPVATTHRDVIIAAVGRHRLPAVYPFRYFVVAGGLASYGPNQQDQFRKAAGYADRILRGANPADLPIQAPTAFELVINLRTAAALGLVIPPLVMARVDETIE